MKLKHFIAILTIAFFGLTPAFASFPVERVAAEQTTTVIEDDSKDAFAAPAASDGKSQIVALLLCWLVGIIGIHRFYLGYTWQGIVQILTLGGLGIWTLIDLVRIIIGTLKPKDGEYDKTF